MKCTKCGKETNVVCLCGICDKCNGVDVIAKKKEFDEFIKKTKEKMKRNETKNTKKIAKTL